MAGTLHLQMGVQAFAESQWAGAESHLGLWAWEEAHEPCISGKETPGRPPALAWLCGGERDVPSSESTPGGSQCGVCVHTGSEKASDCPAGRLVKALLTQSQPVANCRGGEASSRQRQHKPPGTWTVTETRHHSRLPVVAPRTAWQRIQNKVLRQLGNLQESAR